MLVMAAPPLLSVGFAVGACTAFTVSYVGGLYLLPATRVGTLAAKGEVMDRNHPRVIKARMLVASISTLLSVVSTGAILASKVVKHSSAWWPFRVRDVLALIGLPLPSPSLLNSNTLPFDPSMTYYLGCILRQTLLPLGLTATLFAGPLYVAYLYQQLPFQAHFDFDTDVRDKVSTLPGLRNFVVGPVTEELVFRGCFLPLLYFSGVSRSALVFGTPIFFGLAHVHHAYNMYIEGGRTSAALKRGLLTALVQFTYTGLFGWYADFLFLRTANVMGPIAAHVFCNVMGLPNPSSASDDFPKKKTAIFAVHMLGIALFIRGLYPLTSSALLGSKSIYWP